MARRSGSEEPKSPQKKEYKYWRYCKLPSCRIYFGTNRPWQYFHEPPCQKEYQKLLRRSHDDLTVELEVLKEQVKDLMVSFYRLIGIDPDKRYNVKLEIERINLRLDDQAVAITRNTNVIDNLSDQLQTYIKKVDNLKAGLKVVIDLTKSVKENSQIIRALTRTDVLTSDQDPQKGGDKAVGIRRKQAPLDKE